MGLEKLSESVYTWFRYSATLGYDLNGHWLGGEEGNLLVDPPELTDDEADEIESLGDPQLILITNHTHWRATAGHLERWPVPVAAHGLDAPRLPRADRLLADGELLPGGWRVLHVPGKTLGEIALHQAEGRGVLLVGDTLIGQPAGAVRLLPDHKLEDRERLMESLERIARLEFEMLLVGDGQSIFGGAGRVVREFVRSLGSEPAARRGAGRPSPGAQPASPGGQPGLPAAERVPPRSGGVGP